MRRRAGLVALAVVATTCTAVVTLRERPAPPPLAPPAAALAPSVLFRDVLAPYGAWRQLEPYGWAWSPYPDVVGSGFMPYVTSGAWQPTDRGWMWMSLWDWGWAPFHYGRWLWQAPDGWLWIPDARWAPAWVAWRASGGLVGWAPLPPTRPDGLDPPSYWVFVPRRALTAAHVEQALLPVEDTPRALALSAPLRALGEDEGHSWFVGPPLAEHEWPETVRPPGAEELRRPPPLGAPRTGWPRQPEPRILHGPLPAHGVPGLVPPLPPDVPR